MLRTLALLVATGVGHFGPAQTGAPPASPGVVVPSVADNPTVTFYTGTGDPLAAWEFGSKHDKGGGYVWDGDALLFSMRWPDFITLRFQPGVHTFLATTSRKHPSYNSQATLLLERGKHYFLRAETEDPKFESIPVVGPGLGAAVPNPMARWYVRLDLLECAAADKDLQTPIRKYFGNHAQVKPKRIEKGVLPNVVAGYPPCTPAASAPAH